MNLSALVGTEVLISCKTLCAYPTIAANGSYVYVSWTPPAPSKGGQAIYFTTGFNNGASVSFNTPVDIAPLTDKSWHEQEMAAWGNNVVVIWDSGSVSYTVSHDNGGSFSAHTNIDQTLAYPPLQSLGSLTLRYTGTTYMLSGRTIHWKVPGIHQEQHRWWDTFGTVYDLSKGTTEGLGSLTW